MITIWLAIKAYLIAKAPEYVKDVVSWPQESVWW